LDGGAGNDTITGSAWPDQILGGPGDDVIDPRDAKGVDFFVCINDPDFTDITLVGCPDFIDGEQGYNTLIYNDPVFNDLPTRHGIVIDAGGRSRLEGVAVTDPTRAANGESRSNVLAIGNRGTFHTARLVGTQGDDQIYGTPNDDTMVGRGGADVMCGGYGDGDTVDYSGSGGAVNVSLNTNLTPDARWNSALDSDWSLARGDCRQTDASGEPQPNLEKDCIPDDGEAGEGDCVGVDTENITGSSHDDTLTGVSPGPFVHVAAFFAPRGRNVLDGGGGNDTLNGLGGADVLNGGEGTTDTVDYSWETLPVKVSLDGAANDGSSSDGNPDSGAGDSVG
jgi:Ca2+-binding RTX toxin-like protein